MDGWHRVVNHTEQFGIMNKTKGALAHASLALQTLDIKSHRHAGPTVRCLGLQKLPERDSMEARLRRHAHHCNRAVANAGKIREQAASPFPCPVLWSPSSLLSPSASLSLINRSLLWVLNGHASTRVREQTALSCHRTEQEDWNSGLHLCPW